MDRHSPSRRLALGFSPRLERRLLAPIALLVVVGIGTVGYSLLEDWPPLDALYMTVITMTTVGYGETRPLSEAGRIFTIGLIITSISLAGYAVSVLAAFVVEGELANLLKERRMDKRLTKLENHVILCGGGRTGKYIADEFYRTHTPFVLIESDPAVIENVLALGDIPYLQADATEDETLVMAGIERARGLIAALGDDKDNLFVVLSARALNPRLRVIARVSEEANTGKLRKAGADEVISPNAIGGLRMASVMLRPAVVSFLDEMLRVSNQTLRVEEVHVENVPWLEGKTLGTANIRQRTGMLVVAIKEVGEAYKFNPGPDTVLDCGDILIVMGTPDQIAILRQAHEGGLAGDG
jgi:voltage-gated potassium channel